MAFRARKVFRTFEKQAPGSPKHNSKMKNILNERSHFKTYSEKCLTSKVIISPSNEGGVSSLSVISIQSCSSELDSLKRTRIRTIDISMSLLLERSPKDNGSWMLTGFRNSTALGLVIRNIGPGKICFFLNNFWETS